MVSAGSIRRNSVSSLFPDPVHTCHVHVMLHGVLLTSARIADDPFFFTCHRSSRSIRENYKPNWMQYRSIYVLTKEEYTVWLTVQSVFFSFLFLSLHDGFRERDGRGHL